MRRSRILLVPIAVVALLLASCGDDAPSTSPSTTTSSTTTTTTTTSTTTTTTSTTTTTTVPGPFCESDAALGVINDALAAARLPVPAAWDGALADTSFVDRTTTADEYAARLGLDCGLLLAADDDERSLAIAAWTGPRVAFAVQTTATPTEPYRAEAFVRNPVTEDRGEFVTGDMSVWAASGPEAESIVLGHVDYSLGAASKGWAAGPTVPPDEEINLAAEQHAIDALMAAGMRNVGIAQTPELGSEEGYVQFVSITGQISVADVAPTDWFDPLLPRYYTGETTIESIDGVDVRLTLPNPDDNLGFVQAAEVAFACDEFVWILEPPFNGTVAEMLATATMVIATDACHG